MDADLVEYLVVLVPDLESVACVASAFRDLVERETIRILDGVVVARDREGRVAINEMEQFTSLTGCGRAELSGMLTERDLALIASEVPFGRTAIVVVVEDRWAETLSAAARRTGGQILAGERIPAERVLRVLEEALQEE